jgi:hypothetical protein
MRSSSWFNRAFTARAAEQSGYKTVDIFAAENGYNLFRNDCTMSFCNIRGSISEACSTFKLHGQTRGES